MKKYIKPFAVLSAAIALSSCLKEKQNFDPSDSNAVIEIGDVSKPVNFAASDLAGNVYATAFTLAPSADLVIPINYTGVGTAPQDITVTLETNQALLDQYNTKFKRSYLYPTSDLYTLPSLTVTIPKGQKKANLVIKLNVDKLGFTKAYAFAFKIKSVSPGQVSGNFNSAMIQVAPRNIYDGIYSDKGFVVRAGDDGTLAGAFSGQIINLPTLGSATRVSFVPRWKDGNNVGGINNTYIEVDPATNKVQVKSSDNPAVTNLPTYNNRYDPATKTFYLSFYWGSGPSNRAHTDTLVYTGPRP